MGGFPLGAAAGSLADPKALQERLQAIADAHPGRVGICAQDARSTLVCVNADQRFSLQSVMKVVVGTAVMAAVDENKVRLEDPVTVRREHLSLYVQPIERIVAEEGSFSTTIGDLMRRAVVESDSAATDILIAGLGGPSAAHALLTQKGITGIRIDRDERHLQTEIAGLQWKPDYVFPERLKAAIETVPKAARDAAFQTYLKDERDTATPKGMVSFLHALASGRLLSPASTDHLLNVMSQTVTFPDRLRAGAPAGWRVAHKTGTSQTWNGVTAATNDVGILTAPDGGIIAIAVFVADSTASSKERAAVIAAAAREVTKSYR
jgi:beta-lactamase class A